MQHHGLTAVPRVQITGKAPALHPGYSLLAPHDWTEDKTAEVVDRARLELRGEKGVAA